MNPPDSSPVYLAIDLGAGSGRVMAGLLPDGKLRLEEVHRFANEGLRLGDTWHWNSSGLFAEIVKGLKKAGDAYGQRVRGIGVDTWGVDYGLVDARGSLLGLPVMYRDARTDGMMDKAFAHLPAPDLYRATGNQFMAFNTVFQLLAEQTFHPGRLAAAERILWTPDLINAWLCGVQANESTIASTSQLVDARTGAWAWPVIDALGLPRKLFGDILPPGRDLGPLLQHLRDACGLPNARVFTVGSHDTASAVAAVPSEGEDTVYLSSGTWSLLGVLSPKAVINDASFELAFTNEGGADGQIRLLKNISGLWLIQECKRHWDAEGTSVDWDGLVAAAAAAPAFVSLINPDDPRFATPGDMPARIRDFCRASGQPVPADRAAMARLIFESLALKYRLVRDKLETLLGRRLGTFHIVGGGSKNRLLNQFAANALDREVVAGPVEATAAGNVLAQLLADGRIASFDEGRALVRASFGVERFHPADGAAWSAQLTRFKTLCGEPA